MKIYNQMTFLNLTLCLVFLATACSSKDKKIETLKTNLTGQTGVNANESIGKNVEGDLVYQRKTNLVNELVKLEDEVNNLQDRVYGTPDYNSKGLYGKAMECRKAKAQKTGELTFVPDKTPVVEEDQLRIGEDEQSKKLIGLAEENLQKRMERFKEYKKVLYSRQEQIERYIEKCEIDMK